MRDKVLPKVFSYSVQGKMKAAKLFLDFTGNSDLQGNNINTQNNYIQINQYKLTQEIIQKLDIEQLNQIESILKTSQE
jgi:hypothetical protein